MKVSLNTVKQLINADLPPVDELVECINQQLGGVEEVTHLKAKYQGALIVKLVNVEKHPNADRLSVCKIDDGHAIDNVERDGNGHIQVVCGAPNVHTNMWAVWLSPGTTVPASFDTPEPFMLDARELRGMMSSGMLAAGDELGINSDHEGIVELTEADLPPHLDDRTLHAGQNFAEIFGLDDTIVDIENKMFTHRPDCFGQLGVAREIFAILQPTPPADALTGVGFSEPEWYRKLPQFQPADGLELRVFNDTNQKTPRFMAVVLRDVEVKPSPLWLQCKLVALGSKSINNVVDATNYIMLMTAQPTHAYDYDKLHGQTLGVRMAKSGEIATLLNGKTYQLHEDDIVIADGDGVVGLAGVMGGVGSEVSETTKNLVLEVATFDMYTIRKTSMRHGIFTDAVTRFSKGQSPLQNDRVLKKLMEQIAGTQASDVYDLFDRSSELAEMMSLSGDIRVSPEFINQRLGTNFTGYQIANILQFANFTTFVADDETMLSCTAPYWRSDIAIPEDIVEEVGRLYGFDKLPRELPMRTISPAPKNINQLLKQKIRDSLKNAGSNEVLTYSFVHENIIKRAEQDVSQAFRLSNALSPELQYYRLSVLPSLLDKVYQNIKAGYDQFVLFEIGKGHNKQKYTNDDEGLPHEFEMIDAVYASKQPQTGAAYYQMQRQVTQLVHDLGFEIVYKPIDQPIDLSLSAPFDFTRSAVIESREGKFIGIIGELKTSVKKSFKLPEYTAAMTLDFDGLKEATNIRHRKYMPLSRFPSTSQDISLRSSVHVTYQEILDTILAAISEKPEDLQIHIEPVSIYQSPGDYEHKTTTFHLTFTHYQRTLSDNDIAPLMDQIAAITQEKLRTERI